MIILPSNLLQVYNKDTGYHDVYTIYINSKETSATDKELRILCVGKPNKYSEDDFDDGIFFFKISLLDGKVMESLKDGNDLVGNDAFKPRLFQFVLNTLLYITSKDCDMSLRKSQYPGMLLKLKGLKSPRKRKKLESKLRRESTMGRFIVGGSVELSKGEEKLYRVVRSHGKHSVRYHVGGHWRLQWYGHEKDKYQLQKWIKPHLRGPELANIIKSVGIIK